LAAKSAPAGEAAPSHDGAGVLTAA
jgi:hypothetical protein